MKRRYFFGLIVMAVAVIITLIGCATLFPPQAEFPSDFAGTWERVNLEYPHPLTITSRAIKASNQSYSWIISSIQGDSYRLILNNGTGRTDANGTIHLKLVGDYLEIIDAYDAQNAHLWAGGENDWTGTWKRK